MLNLNNECNVGVEQRCRYICICRVLIDHRQKVTSNWLSELVTISTMFPVTERDKKKMKKKKEEGETPSSSPEKLLPSVKKQPRSPWDAFLKMSGRVIVRPYGTCVSLSLSLSLVHPCVSFLLISFFFFTGFLGMREFDTFI